MGVGVGKTDGGIGGIGGYSQCSIGAAGCSTQGCCKAAHLRIKASCSSAFSLSSSVPASFSFARRAWNEGFGHMWLS